jgi:YHS domain-containing protein
MKNEDFIKAHDRVKDFDWKFSYEAPPSRYEMPYKIPVKTNDPFRHLIRDYTKMERDKDDRQYGAMSDVMARAKMPAKASERWTEVLKMALPVTTYAEYAAMKCTGQLVDAVENAELRQGYLAQMMDEVRHTNQEAHLIRYLCKHARDSEGFDRGFRMRGLNLITRASRNALDGFFSGDPIEGALNLQVVAETCYTNPIFVTLTEVAAANGDEATPTTFLSVQSDEARHMANGYSTLAAVASMPDNLPRLQRDFDNAFWRQHSFLDPFIGAVYDYFQENRGGSYLEAWKEWVGQDWAGSYIERLQPFGLNLPRGWQEASQERVPWMHHTVIMVLAATWPLQFMRVDPLTPKDFEWFEKKYPGWYGHYGKFWEGYAMMTDPKNGQLAMSMFPVMPPICRVCQMPCVFPRVEISAARIREYGGRKHAFCSNGCEHLFACEPHRYARNYTWFEHYDGYDIAQYIEESGLIRSDGKTLVAQPSLRWDKMWTIDDIRAQKIGISDPLKDLPADGAPQLMSAWTLQ